MAGVARHFPADAQGNVVRGRALLEACQGNIVMGENGRLTALLGVDNLIVVQTPDATLICPQSRAQEIKKLVTRLSSEDPGLV